MPTKPKLSDIMDQKGRLCNEAARRWGLQMDRIARRPLSRGDLGFYMGCGDEVRAQEGRGDGLRSLRHRAIKRAEAKSTERERAQRIACFIRRDGIARATMEQTKRVVWAGE
jgi:hypothetical protein